MISRWVRQLFWRPFEAFCRVSPIVPVRLEVKELLPGIKCLRFGNGPIRFLSWFAGGYDYAVIYLIDDELVFDSGFGWCQKALKHYIEKNSLDQTLRTVINSHFHEDHVGCNKVFVDLCGVKVFAHPEAIKHIAYVYEREFYRHFLFGSYDPAPVSAIDKSYKTKNCVFEVIETPGHTPDHICLYEPQKKILFSGDLFINATLTAQLREVNGPKWIASLKHCVTLDIEYLFDGHGSVISGAENVRRALQSKLDFLESLQARVLTIAKTEKCIDQITKAVLNDGSLLNQISLNEGWMSVITSGSFANTHMVQSFLYGPLQPTQIRIAQLKMRIAKLSVNHIFNGFDFTGVALQIFGKINITLKANANHGLAPKRHQHAGAYFDD